MGAKTNIHQTASFVRGCKDHVLGCNVIVLTRSMHSGFSRLIAFGIDLFQKWTKYNLKNQRIHKGNVNKLKEKRDRSAHVKRY